MMLSNVSKSCLVTGADGFIGMHMVTHLSEQAFSVRTTSRSATSALNNIPLNLTIPTFPETLCESIDTIFHLAGKAHAVVESKDGAADYQAINTDGTLKLLEAAHKAGVKRFVYFSSVKAVSDACDQAMDESAMVPATDAYGRSKWDAEQLVLHGGYVPYPVVIRPSMVYGLTTKGNLPRMIRAIDRGWFPPVLHSQQYRSMVHVDDVVQAAVLAAEQPAAAGQIYIVTDEQAYATRQLYDWIRAALGRAPLTASVPLPVLQALARVGDGIGAVRGRRFVFDSDALDKLIGPALYSSNTIREQLGFRPQQTLERAMPSIVQHVLAAKC